MLTQNITKQYIIFFIEQFLCFSFFIMFCKIRSRNTSFHTAPSSSSQIPIVKVILEKQSLLFPENDIAGTHVFSYNIMVFVQGKSDSEDSPMIDYGKAYKVSGYFVESK